MSRSVSAPSSVTKTSPCWNGLIVPGSTLRYGSNFWSWTRRPRALSKRPSEAATIPFPRADTTPPVTKTYFGARALTGFQGSSGCGWRLPGRLADERGKPRQRLRGGGPPEAAEARRLDGERGLRFTVLHRPEVELDLGMLAGELEGDARQRDHLDEEKRSAELRAPAEARPLRAFELPVRARSERPPDRGVHPDEARPPFRPARRVGEHVPDVLDGRRERPPSLVPRQGTPARRACARAPPCAPPRRAARCGCAWGLRESSPPGNDDRQGRRSAAGA